MFESETLTPHYETVMNNCAEGLRNPFAYVTQVIIPHMSERRRSGEPLSDIDICHKLFDVDPSKPNEASELFEIVLLGPVWKTDLHLCALVFLEVADICYYANQPNCHVLMSDPTPLFISLGISPAMAGQACVIKYTTRLQFGDLPNYREIELAVMKKWLTMLDIVPLA